MTQYLKKDEATVSIDYQRVARALSPQPGEFDLQFNIVVVEAHAIDRHLIKTKYFR